MADLERLRVRLPGRRLRTLSTRSLPVAVRPGRGGHYRDVRVLEPLAFGARTDAPIPWRLRTPGRLVEGVLWAARRTPLREVREWREGVEVAVELRPGVVARRVRLACEAITIGAPRGTDEEAAEPPATGPGPRWWPRSDHLWLAARRGGGPSVRLDTADLEDPPTLVELERRDHWVRVAATFPASGTAVRGWVQRLDLRPASRPAYPDPGASTRGGSARDARPPERSAPGSGVAGRPADDGTQRADDTGQRADDRGTQRADDRGTQRADDGTRRADDGTGGHASCAAELAGEPGARRVLVALGALVHARPGRDAWALITGRAVMAVTSSGRGPWVRILAVPGLREDGECAIRDAWVHRRTVTGSDGRR